MPLIHVSFTADERTAGEAADGAKLDQAAAALRTEGVVVLKGACCVEQLQVLGQRMRHDLELATASGWELDDNWQGLTPPHSRPYLFKDVIFNRLACEVAQRVLGLRSTLALSLLSQP